MSNQEIQQQMADMKSFDEPMPQVGIFWYDPEEKAFFGVRKQELTPKQVEEAADQGLPFINYPHLHRHVWAKEYFLAQASGQPVLRTGSAKAGVGVQAFGEALLAKEPRHAERSE